MTTKIVIAGLGGVGGYFGGLLAQKYSNDKAIEIIFFARGEHLKQIQNHGLKVMDGNKEFYAIPKLATSDASEIGKADYILLCTKSYSLEESVAQLKPCIAAHTIILPLQNGVDNTERVAAMLQEGKVIKGCAYIVSKIIAPAVIQNSGNIQKLYFGANGESDEKLAQLETIFKAANIDAYLSPEISKIVWEKFIFISATATATTYFNCSIGQLLQTEETTLLNLIEEVRLLAQKKGMQPDPDIVAQTMLRLRSLPFETTSSMHRDLLNGNKEFEIGSLTAYVVKEAEKLNLLLPTYTAIYEQLIRKYGE